MAQEFKIEEANCLLIMITFYTLLTSLFCMIANSIPFLFSHMKKKLLIALLL